MTEAAEKFLAQLPPEEAAMLRRYIEEEKRNPNPELAHFKQLAKKVRDGTATPEELAEYEEEMRPINERMKEQEGRTVYDDSY